MGRAIGPPSMIRPEDRQSWCHCREACDACGAYHAYEFDHRDCLAESTGPPLPCGCRTREPMCSLLHAVIVTRTKGGPTMTTKLWEFELGGCVYHWVAAADPDAARALLLAEAPDVGECVEAGDELEIVEVERERGERLRFVRDDGARVSMWSEFERDPSPRLVACSEW